MLMRSNLKIEEIVWGIRCIIDGQQEFLPSPASFMFICKSKNNLGVVH